MNLLESLKRYTTVVADTGGRSTPSPRTRPQDATTNPSLLFQAAQQPQYQHLVDDALDYCRGSPGDSGGPHRRVHGPALRRLRLRDSRGSCPAAISTEVDCRPQLRHRGERWPRPASSSACTSRRAIGRAASPQQRSPPPGQGIRAAEILQREGINCNLTLLFSLAQAIACAEANVTLISPFVGRIMDWYKKKTQRISSPPTTIRASVPSRGFTTTTRNLTTEPKSWAPASARSTRSCTWPAATC